MEATHTDAGSWHAALYSVLWILSLTSLVEIFCLSEYLILSLVLLEQGCGVLYDGELALDVLTAIIISFLADK